MTSFQDYELQKTSAESQPAVEPETHPVRKWMIPAVATVAAAVAVYVVFLRRPLPPAQPPSAAAPKAAPAGSTPGSLGQQSNQIDLPPLNDSDPVVRTLVRSLSKSPAIESWLTTNGLIRNFVVVVLNVSEGATPVKQLGPLRPSKPFQVVERDGRQYIDPRSYDRYSPIADAVASVDAAGAAKLYSTLKPRIEEAYRELGVPGSAFDGAVERAIVTLLSTPVISGSIRVKPKGIGYGFADDRLERLTAAQKQLLRMGPRNAERIEAKLREIAVAIGIPPGELPSGGK